MAEIDVEYPYRGRIREGLIRTLDGVAPYPRSLLFCFFFGSARLK